MLNICWMELQHIMTSCPGLPTASAEKLLPCSVMHQRGVKGNLAHQTRPSSNAPRSSFVVVAFIRGQRAARVACLACYAAPNATDCNALCFLTHFNQFFNNM